MQETLNLDQNPSLHKTSVSGSTSDKDWAGNKNSIFIFSAEKLNGNSAKQLL